MAYNLLWHDQPIIRRKFDVSITMDVRSMLASDGFTHSLALLVSLRSQQPQLPPLGRPTAVRPLTCPRQRPHGGIAVRPAPPRCTLKLPARGPRQAELRCACRDATDARGGGRGAVRAGPHGRRCQASPVTLHARTRRRHLRKTAAFPLRTSPGHQRQRVHGEN